MKKENTNKKIRICCIGAGYVGGPTMAVLADNCPQIQVNIVDTNSKRIDLWNDKDLNKIPVYEPNLVEIISRTRNKNLFFSTNVSNEINLADIVFICVNTPTKKKGLGAGKASDLKWIELCAKEVAKSAKGHTIVVEKSTVPVKTAEVIKTILKSKENASFSVLSNPEFLSEGSAIYDLQNPDRVLIGGDNNDSIEVLANIYKNWIDDAKIVKTNLWSSELSKLTSNAFLAQRISSINSISALCEITGADVNEVAEAIGKDSRIGNKFLRAGPGFGGSCFQKDILNLVYLCEHFGLEDVANYWDQVIKINDWQKRRISNLIIEKLFGTLTEKKIAIFGFSYKANTNDTRDSPSIQLCKDLLEESAFLSIHDPKVKSQQIEDEFKNFVPFLNTEKYQENINWNYSESIEECLRGAHAAVFMTEWEEYKNIDWTMLENIMERPSWIFDTRMICDPKQINKTNINFWRIGSSSYSPN